MATFFGTTDTATFFGTTGTGGAATWYGTQVIDGGGSGGVSGTLNYVVLEPLTDPTAIAAWVTAVDGQDSNADSVFNDGILTTNDTTAQVAVGANDPVLFDQIVIFQAPANGRATALAATISYVPNTNFVGRDVVGYTLMRQGALVGSGYLFIGVVSPADPPDTGGEGETGGGTTTTGSLTYDAIALQRDENNCYKADDLFSAVEKLVETHNKIEGITAGRVILK